MSSTDVKATIADIRFDSECVECKHFTMEGKCDSGVTGFHIQRMKYFFCGRFERGVHASRIRGSAK